MGVKYCCGFGLFLFLGCSPALPKDENSYLAWIANPIHGLNQTKKTEVFELSVQYIPAAYQAWKEIQAQPEFTTSQKDSIYATHRQNLYFIFTITPREDRVSGDVLYSGVRDKADFEQRVRTLNFGMADYWQLQVKQGNFPPILSNFENTYGLTNFRKLHLVFAPSDTLTNFHKMPQWDLVFNDEVFGTGIHHFVFDQEDWERVLDPIFLY